MATNPLNVKPTELIRLMNRAGFGTVLNESRLKTHRLNDINTADHKGVDLLKYAGSDADVSALSATSAPQSPPPNISNGKPVMSTAATRWDSNTSPIFRISKTTANDHSQNPQNQGTEQCCAKKSAERRKR